MLSRGSQATRRPRGSWKPAASCRAHLEGAWAASEGELQKARREEAPGWGCAPPGLDGTGFHADGDPLSLPPPHPASAWSLPHLSAATVLNSTSIYYRCSQATLLRNSIRFSCLRGFSAITPHKTRLPHWPCSRPGFPLTPLAPLWLLNRPPAHLPRSPSSHDPTGLLSASLPWTRSTPTCPHPCPLPRTEGHKGKSVPCVYMCGCHMPPSPAKSSHTHLSEKAKVCTEHLLFKRSCI